MIVIDKAALARHLERYDLGGYVDEVYMEPFKVGEYVRYEDVETELARLRRVEAAHDALMSQCLKVTGAYSNGIDLQADREIRRLDLLLDELAEKAALEETTP